MHVKTLAIVLYAGLAAAAARPQITSGPVRRAAGLDDSEMPARVRPRAPQASKVGDVWLIGRDDIEERDADVKKRHASPQNPKPSEIFQNWKRNEAIEERQPLPENSEPTRTIPERRADDLERRRARPQVFAPSGVSGGP
ncbi:hypothetical protein E2P81_ATG09175 [Venturia nashicola]|nr:hypothetical protein E2P81_ATG09175 [Venturia nashicola]